MSPSSALETYTYMRRHDTHDEERAGHGYEWYVVSSSSDTPA
jgi:hypothetical protein